MGYILVDAGELDRQNIPHGEVLPDGRAVISVSMLRVMESVGNIEFVSSEAEVRERMTAIGYKVKNDKHAEEQPPADAEQPQMEKPSVSEQSQQTEGQSQQTEPQSQTEEQPQSQGEVQNEVQTEAKAEVPQPEKKSTNIKKKVNGSAE